jgi:cytochrome b561
MIEDINEFKRDWHLTPMEIINEAYGPVSEWSESALIPLFRVMELTRQDEQIRQMDNAKDHQRFIVENIINLLMIQHEAAAGRHNYYLHACNLIKVEYGIEL